MNERSARHHDEGGANQDCVGDFLEPVRRRNSKEKLTQIHTGSEDGRQDGCLNQYGTAVRAVQAQHDQIDRQGAADGCKDVRSDFAG